MATKIYAAAVGRPIPRIKEAAIVSTKATSKLPPDRVTIKLLNFNPTPVSVTTAIIIPAVAVAIATGKTACAAAFDVEITLLGTNQVDGLRQDSKTKMTIDQRDEYITE